MVAGTLSEEEMPYESRPIGGGASTGYTAAPAVQSARSKPKWAGAKKPAAPAASLEKVTDQGPRIICCMLGGMTYRSVSHRLVSRYYLTK